MINKDGKLETQILGDALLDEKALYHFAIPAGTWIAAELCDKSQYGFLSETVTPGFEFEHFEVADTKKLCQEFPEHEELFQRFSLSGR